MRTLWFGWIGAMILGAALSSAALADDETKPEATPETTVDPAKGFVTFRSGDNSLTLGAWGQFRLTVDDRQDFDADTAGTGLGQADGAAAAFSIPRLRMYLLGTVYAPWMRYRIEVEVANLKTDATTNINNGRITDGYFEFARSPAATLRAGQYKIPFGLEQLNPDGRLEFVERSIADAKFAPGRDVGLMLSGLFLDKRIGYQAAVFNGAGQNNPQDDKSLLYAARVVYDPLGEYKLIESAVEHPEKSVLHFGLAYRFGEATRGLSSVGIFQDPNNETALGFEVAWKLRRYFAMGEYFEQRDEQTNPTQAPDIDAKGFAVQAGVFVVPSRQELALRFASVEPDKSVADATQTEMRLVYGYYWQGHNMKFQADAGEIKYAQNFASLPALALRGVSPLLQPPSRLVPLPGQEITDKQFRGQFVLAF